MKKTRSLTIFMLLLFAACKNNPSGDNDIPATANAIAAPANIGYTIVATYPHDTASYTQGLIWQNNILYEGTGLEGESRLLKEDVKSGKATRSISLDPTVFGEGITLLNRVC